MTAIFLQRQS